MVDRDQGYSQIKASNGTWDKMASLCYGGQSKRNLEVRIPEWPPITPAGFTQVRMGESKGEKGPLGLWTFGLFTCLGLGVTGIPKNHTGNSRFLMHFMVSEGKKEDDQWNPFHKLVKDASLENMKGWMSIPDLSQQLPVGWSDLEAGYVDLVIKRMVQKMTELTGKAPKTVARPMALVVKHQLPHGTMQIDRNNEVEMDGYRVTQ
ncbi:hypothetical protein EV356DRAFT_504763 [Viridothelium virens]|uniref:Uncharacterized protein n=1 Tax=Viridothelium virens TaxID=1048519 RepID=A0A6A6H4E9_VIRVR|nr:hypothetical protein EV356DRAFT_504763 [Viridothelium virens]